MKLPPANLERLVNRIFTAAGCQATEAERIAHYLVEANLTGHDSHGVIRVATYVQWLREGKVFANQQLKIVQETDVLSVCDGQFGFGQVMGEATMKLGIAKAERHGVAVVALRNSGHLGRIGDWAEMAASAGQLSLHFVNTSGGGILVAPHGGINRRLSANPIAAGVPVRTGPPIIMDMSTSTIAEGKIRVALNKGTQLPDQCVIDAQGRPTNDPQTFYGPPPGAILPLGGHKGYALCYIVEMLAGALTGGGCSNPAEKRVANSMLTILLSPRFFVSEDDFQAEVQRFGAYVKSSEKVAPDSDILAPGEIEERNRQYRRQHGIELDDRTWSQILDAAGALGISRESGLV